MKIKKAFQLFMITLCFFMVVQAPISAFAYDKKTYTYDTGEGCYLVDNSASKTTDNRITLYVLVPKLSTLESMFCYTFKCTSNNFKDSDYYATLGFDILAHKSRFDTCVRLNENVGTGQVVSFKFNIENGTYVFSTNDSTDTVTLTPDFKNPMDIPINYLSDSTIASSIKEYPLTLTNDSINLYAIYGDGDFVSANATAFADYASGKQSTTGVSTSNDAEQVQIAKALDSLTGTVTNDELKVLADELLNDQPVDIKYSDIDVNEIASAKEGVSIATSNVVAPVENDRALGVKDILLVICGIIVLFVIIKFVRKK